MKRTGIFMVSGAVFAILLAVILLFPGTPAFQPETSAPSSESTPIPTGKSEFALPDASYSLPEEEEPPIQTQPPVESKATPWAIVKVASELPLLSPAKAKTVTLPDKTVTASYYGKGYQEWANTTSLYTYEADDGDVLQFDAVGGELVYYERAKKPAKEGKTVSLEQAQVVAETFAREHIDLSRYTPTCQNTLHDGNYWFQYVRYIGDMPTQDIVNVITSPSGVLLEYGANPHLFDCVQIGTVDKAALRQRFEEKLRAKGQSTNYMLKGEIIGLNDLGEPCVKYRYYYNRDDGTPIPVNYNIEIPLTE